MFNHILVHNSMNLLAKQTIWFYTINGICKKVSDNYVYQFIFMWWRKPFVAAAAAKVPAAAAAAADDVAVVIVVVAFIFKSS